MAGALPQDSAWPALGRCLKGGSYKPLWCMKCFSKPCAAWHGTASGLAGQESLA